MRRFAVPHIDILRDRLNRLYGERGPECFRRMQMMVGRYGVGDNIRPADSLWDEKDAVLITYGDMVRSPGERPLRSLRQFLCRHVRDAFSTVHILPFCPFSSDDGFSVIDYRQVEPDLGTWDDIEAIGNDFQLMVDLVLNHASRRSRWFRDYVAGISPARFYFVEVEPETDLSSVVRPRSGPLLHATQTPHGEKLVWTTFSEDQMDLDFANADVLFEFLDILFYYVSRGARIVRLDAIAYLWKKPGTPCIHLPETHEIVKLFRDVVDLVAPGVVLLTETNVPHEENVSYFGDGDEAHMVYQFTLPPLLLHALQTGQSRYLTEWAASLPDLPAGETFFNFTASHDGIGVRPLEGILPAEDIERLVQGAKQRGGYVSTKKNADGTDSPYELNITYFDALRDAESEDDPNHVARFLCSQTIPLALRGIPAVYFNSLIAACNYREGVAATQRSRTINRRKWDAAELAASIAGKNSAAGRVLRRLAKLLALRGRHPAFHPDGAQRVLPLGDAVFAVERTSPDQAETVVAVSNLTDRNIQVKLDDRVPGLASASDLTDLIHQRKFGPDGRTLSLGPYKTAWLTPGEPTPSKA